MAPNEQKTRPGVIYVRTPAVIDIEDRDSIAELIPGLPHFFIDSEWRSLRMDLWTDTDCLRLKRNPTDFMRIIGDMSGLMRIIVLAILGGRSCGKDWIGRK